MQRGGRNFVRTQRWSECYEEIARAVWIQNVQKGFLVVTGIIMSLTLALGVLVLCEDMTNVPQRRVLAFVCLGLGLPSQAVDYLANVQQESSRAILAGLILCDVLWPKATAAAGAACAGAAVVYVGLQHPVEDLDELDLCLVSAALSSFLSVIMHCGFLAATLTHSTLATRITIVGSVASVVAFTTVLSIVRHIHVAVELRARKGLFSYERAKRTAGTIRRMARRA